MKAPPFRAAPSMSFPSDMAVHDRDQQILFPGFLQIRIERFPIGLQLLRVASSMPNQPILPVSCHLPSAVMKA